MSESQLREVTDAILCEGKCGKTVYTGELTDACPIATQMKLEAADYLAQGMTPNQALDRFVADFGEDVLAAPPKSGINMIPWLLPVGGLALGIAAVAKAMANWRGQERPASTVQLPETGAEMRSRIDDEVNEGL